MKGSIVRRVALPIIIIGRAASADPAPATVDLTLKQLPAQLKMRPAKKVAQTPAPPAAGAPATPPPDATATTAPPASTSQNFTPATHRSVMEHVNFKINAGVELDSAPASGETLRGGAALPPGFNDSRPWIAGDAMIGVHDVVLPSLNGYFLSSFQFDASNSLADRSALVMPSDAAGQNVAIKAGYAEYGRDDKADNDTSHFWLRAGRQFRLDGGNMFAYFDGATIGYRTNGWEVSAFGGQRVALYVDTQAGLTYGATASVDLKKMKDIPLKIALDFMGLAIDDFAPSVDTFQPPVNPTSTTSIRSLVSLSAVSDPTKQVHIEVRGRAVDGGDGFAFGRAGARIRYAPNGSLLVVADIEQRGGGDLAYDLASPSAVDVVDVARKLGVGLAPPVDSTIVGAHVDYRRGEVEFLGFGRAQFSEGSPQAGTAPSVDQESYVEAGAAIAGSALAGVYISGQYTFRDYSLDESANTTVMNGTTLVSPFFDNTAGSGISSLHELAVDATLRSQTRGGNKWRASLGAFYRIYNLETPYVTTDTDGRGGGRGSFSWWFTRSLHADVAGEIAQSSPTLAREIGTMTSIRAALEARW